MTSSKGQETSSSSGKRLKIDESPPPSDDEEHSNKICSKKSKVGEQSTESNKYSSNGENSCSNTAKPINQYPVPKSQSMLMYPNHSEGNSYHPMGGYAPHHMPPYSSQMLPHQGHSTSSFMNYPPQPYPPYYGGAPIPTISNVNVPMLPEQYRLDQHYPQQVAPVQSSTPIAVSQQVEQTNRNVPNQTSISTQSIQI